jgi:drug/metabolite transporter (DMT)-like permease
MWIFIVAAGVGTTIAQYLMTMAYKLQEASPVAAFSFTSILWSTAIGVLIFGEMPGLLEVVGILVLFACLVMLVWLRSSHAPAEGSR